MHYDILIIGGGVIGLSIARELRRRNAGRIVVLEKGTCTGEASWAAAGMLSPAVHTIQADGFYSLCRASSDMYLPLAAELLDETGIDIALDRTGTLDVAFGEEDGQRLLEKYSKQVAAGIAVKTLSLEDVLRIEPELSSTITFAAFYPNDWQVENRKLLAALLRYAELNHIEVRENTDVTGVTIENGIATGVQTVRGPVVGGHTIIATGAWTSLIKLGDAAMPFKVKPIRGQIVEFQGPPGTFVNVIWSDRGYIVPRLDGRVLAGSTSEDVGFDDLVTADARGELTAMALRIAPVFSTMEVVDQWSGLRPFALDGLPVLGSLTGIDGLTLATAHYRNGILLAPVTASLVADRVLSHKDAPAFGTFGPDRFRVAAAR